MTNRERLLSRLLSENKLREHDAVALSFANYCYRNNIVPTIKHNISPTLVTINGCGVAIVLMED